MWYCGMRLRRLLFYTISIYNAINKIVTGSVIVSLKFDNNMLSLNVILKWFGFNVIVDNRKKISVSLYI